VVIYFLWRGLSRRAYFLSFGQRLGFLPASFRQTVPGAIWLHAVSVGEAMAAAELVQHLRQRMPRAPVFVSVSTLAGFAAASRILGAAARVFFAPVDYVFAVRRVVRMLRPSLVIVLETEIWPNLFRETKRTGAGLLIVNARISDGAARRYVNLRWFFGPVLEHADLVLAQSERTRQRLIATGAREAKVRVGGNLKYDAQPGEAAPDSPVRRFLARVSPGAVWIAASTMPPAATGDPDEDDAVVAAFREVAAGNPGLLLVLAPRKPERFPVAAAALERAGVPFVRRSQLGGSETVTLPGALLLDSMGELAGLFPAADVVFMGGTLASRGGHNILEPGLAAKPIVVGPHLENFAEIADDFRAAGALVEVRDAAGLAAAVGELLADRERARSLGSRAYACAQARQGATAGAAQAAHELYKRHVPAFRPAQPGFLLLWLLSRLWIWGTTLNRARDLTRVRRLHAPVISVGNITAGGTGKTPAVLHLARELKQYGWRPGILTRGYGRHSPLNHEALAAGAEAPVEQSGDEPKIFLRSGVAPVGIGPDRWKVGRLLERKFGVNVMILDDGFQHSRLERRIDIVLVDALEPFGRGFALPLGRLREPLEGLGRADIFVITRSDCGRMSESAAQVLRQYNRRAPIFWARARPEAWIDYATGQCMAPDALPYARVGAFCGLGNPESFWHTLAGLGLEVRLRIEYEDHHAYRPREMRHMAHQFREAGVEALVTTEKDAVNLCEDSARLLAPLPLYWLRIDVSLDREEEFLAAVSARLVPWVSET